MALSHAQLSALGIKQAPASQLLYGFEGKSSISKSEWKDMEINVRDLAIEKMGEGNIAAGAILNGAAEKLSAANSPAGRALAPVNRIALLNSALADIKLSIDFGA